MTLAYFRMATPRCSNRLFEWIVGLITIQIGIITLIAPIFGYKSAQLSFIALTEIGFSVVQAGAVFFCFGLLRLIALRLNGQWTLGPHIRVLCATIGFVIWGQLLFGIIMMVMRTGEIYLTLAVWDTLLFGEYISIKRAILDIKHPALKVDPETPVQ